MVKKIFKKTFFQKIAIVINKILLFVKSNFKWLVPNLIRIIELFIK
jgi:hypothetical protein